jgi:DNA polymerase-3 subunit beta
MEAVFERDSLYAAVHTVSAAISLRSPRPVLQCVHLETRGEEIVLSATDLQIAIRYAVTPKELRSGGNGLVAGAKLDGLLREASEDEILLRVEEGKAELRAGRSRFSLVTQDVADYPELPEFPGGAATISAAAFEEMVRHTVFATAEEGGRYAIDGVAMFIERGRMELAATDGRRLAMAWTKVDDASAKLDPCVVPKEMLARARALGTAGETVDIAVDKGRLLARAGGLLVVGSLLEGSFPEYRKMIPEEKGHSVTVSASAFASKLRQASQVTTDGSRAVTFAIEPGKLVISAQSAAVGEGSAEIDASYEGEPLELAFNPQLLLPVATEFAEGSLEMQVSAPDEPLVVRREGFVYVVAPVRVRS